MDYKGNKQAPARGSLAVGGRIGALVSLVAEVLARTAGIVLIVVGVWTGVKVIVEAWGLYTNPVSVGRFAGALETATGLDSVLASGVPPQQDVHQQADIEQSPSPAPRPAAAKTYRLSYLVAWPLVILLLLLLGKLASWAIGAGVRLAFYEIRLGA